MTVIAAYIDRPLGFAAMACDSEYTQGNIKARTARKFVPLGCALVGLAGEVDYMRFLETVDTELEHDDDAYEWTNELIAKAFKWKTPPPADEDEEGNTVTEPVIQCAMLVLTRSNIHVMQGYRTVAEITDNYAAIGTGGDVALGALSLADQLRFPPDKAVRVACESAKRHGAGCGGPVHVGALGFEVKPTRKLRTRKKT